MNEFDAASCYCLAHPLHFEHRVPLRSLAAWVGWVGPVLAVPDEGQAMIGSINLLPTSARGSDKERGPFSGKAPTLGTAGTLAPTPSIIFGSFQPFPVFSLPLSISRTGPSTPFLLCSVAPKSFSLSLPLPSSLAPKALFYHSSRPPFPGSWSLPRVSLRHRLHHSGLLGPALQCHQRNTTNGHNVFVERETIENISAVALSRRYSLLLIRPSTYPASAK